MKNLNNFNGIKVYWGGEGGGVKKTLNYTVFHFNMVL